MTKRCHRVLSKFESFDRPLRSKSFLMLEFFLVFLSLKCGVILHLINSLTSDFSIFLLICHVQIILGTIHFLYVHSSDTTFSSCYTLLPSFQYHKASLILWLCSRIYFLWDGNFVLGQAPRIVICESNNPTIQYHP